NRSLQVNRRGLSGKLVRFDARGDERHVCRNGPETTPGLGAGGGGGDRAGVRGAAAGADDGGGGQGGGGAGGGRGEGGEAGGRDFELACAPGREGRGNARYSTKTIPKLVGGVRPQCGEVAAALYRSFLESVVVVSDARVAEAAKLLENIYRSINIALVNELKMLFERMGIDVWEVIEAAASKPFGFRPFYPGPGLGGPCIPIAPFSLRLQVRHC